MRKIKIGDPFADRFPHGFEQPHAFAFVFDLGIHLGVALQANAAAQVVHRQQVILPRIIDDLQQHLAFHSPHFGMESIVDGTIDC